MKGSPARPETDRIACPWLITRFIDHDAEIVYVPADTGSSTLASSGKVLRRGSGWFLDHISLVAGPLQ